MAAIRLIAEGKGSSTLCLHEVSIRYEYRFADLTVFLNTDEADGYFYTKSLGYGRFEVVFSDERTALLVKLNFG